MSPSVIVNLMARAGCGFPLAGAKDIRIYMIGRRGVNFEPNIIYTTSKTPVLSNGSTSF